MGNFNFEKIAEGGNVLISFEGNVDEDATFSSMDLSGASNLTLDLTKISTINSCGIREWIKWIRGAPSGCKIIYKNCPKVIVDQINMVAGFLPENAEVISFFVPYYCESSGNEKMVLFEKGREFKEGKLVPPESVKDDETGEEMEMDVIEAKYFKFISK